MNTRVVAVLTSVIVVVAAAVFLAYWLRAPPGDEAPPAGGGFVVEDMAGRVVAISGPASRVVALGPGSLRLVVYLNATDLVVGVEEFESRPPLGRDYGYVLHARGLANLPRVGMGGPDSHVNYEALIAARPDLIIMSPALADSPDEVQKKTGVPVVVVSYGDLGTIDLEKVSRALELLGRLLGREERAAELNAYIKRLVEDLDARTRDVGQRKSVYVGAVSFKGGRPFTSTQSRFPPLVLLNTESVVDKYGVKLGAGVDWEVLLREQPDVVFIDLANYHVVRGEFNKSRELFCRLKAFREGEVYGILPFNHYWTNIATVFVNAYFIGKVLYPERFADVDIEKKADEIYRVFLGAALYGEFKRDFYGGFRKLEEFRCGE